MKKTIYTKDIKPTFHATVSNSKLGGSKEKILAVSYVPGAEPIRFKDGRLVSDMIGTCNKVDCSKCAHAAHCYAYRAFIQYNGATVNRMENTLQLRTDIKKHFLDLKAEIIKRKVTTVRYTESGELESYEQFTMLMSLAEEMPTVNFYLYTKAYQYIRKWFESAELPNNVTVLISIWENIGVAEYIEFKDHDGIKAFVVNNDDIKADCSCPAYRLNDQGKAVRVKSDAVKCGNCKLCTRAKQCKVIKCLEH